MAGRLQPRVADVHGVVTTHLPGYRVDSVARIGEGLDNVAYEVNGELIARFARDPTRAPNEAHVLAVVADVSPTPVPKPVFVAVDQGCLAYVKLPGVPLLDLPPRQRADCGASVAGALGELLAALHAVPVDRVSALVDVDDEPWPEWRREAEENYARVRGRVPPERRRPIEAFLGAPLPGQERTLVFSHNDLGIEHVLVDLAPCSVTGVIDWSDAAIVDPAYDFGLIYRDLGPAALHAALRGYGAAEDIAALTDRAVFYARCSVFEDLAYGIKSGRNPYVKKSLAAMEWLFPARHD